MTPRKAAKTAKAAAKAPARTAKKAPAKAATKAPAKKAAPRVVARQGEPPKSIRVHVLEMLAAETRDFGLAEIIDRIHDAGIQAHDDAVRSITIKLMKDGRVERVGRGQYRLARRGAAARAASAATATAPRVTEPAPEPPASVVAPATPALPVEASVPVEAAAPVESPVTPAVVSEPAPVEELEQTDTVASDAGSPEASDDEATGDEQSTDESDFGASSVPRTYTPPLNLGQPWSGGK